MNDTARDSIANDAKSHRSSQRRRPSRIERPIDFHRSELGPTELPTLPFRPPVRPLDPNTLFYLGLALATGSVLFFILGMYAVVISSYMPETGVWILDIVKRDEHYKYFIPSCIPAGLVFVIINWGGLHYFRHA